jgi:hypothetical protein
VKGMGIPTVHNKIINLLAKHDGNESIVLLEYKMTFTKAANIDESTLHTLLMSFLFEPGEIKSKYGDDKITQSLYIYIYIYTRMFSCELAHTRNSNANSNINFKTNSNVDSNTY